MKTFREILYERSVNRSKYIELDEKHRVNGSSVLVDTFNKYIGDNSLVNLASNSVFFVINKEEESLDNLKDINKALNSSECKIPEEHIEKIYKYTNYKNEKIVMVSNSKSELLMFIVIVKSLESLYKNAENMFQELKVVNVRINCGCKINKNERYIIKSGYGSSILLFSNILDEILLFETMTPRSVSRLTLKDMVDIMIRGEN